MISSPLVHVAADVGESEHGGDLTRAGENGGMGGLAPRIRRDAQHELPVQAQGIRRHEIARDEDGGLVHVGEPRALVVAGGGR